MRVGRPGGGRNCKLASELESEFEFEFERDSNSNSNSDSDSETPLRLIREHAALVRRTAAALRTRPSGSCVTGSRQLLLSCSSFGR